MLTNYYLVFIYLVKHVTVTEIQSKKANIKGKQIEHHSSRNVYDYKKYYKELFQPMDVHPMLYGNKPNNTKNIVRGDFNDDIEHDKHTLIFEQVYRFYKKMLNKRKSERNSKLDKVLNSKNMINTHVNLLEEAMKNKMRQIDFNNHKQIVEERQRELEQERLRSQGVNVELVSGNNTREEHAKMIDTSKIKSILNEVKDFVQSKVGNKFNVMQKHNKTRENLQNEDEEADRHIRNDVTVDLRDKIQKFFGFNKGGSSTKRITKTKKTTTTRPTTPNWDEFSRNYTGDGDYTQRTIRGDGFWDEIRSRRLNLTRRQRLKTTWTSDEAMDYWKAWTPDPRYTFGLEEWNGSAVMNATFFSYEEENATHTTLPANWLTWLYSGVSEDLANQTTYESCPTNEIYDRWYNTTWSLEFQHTLAKNATLLWPHKDMFKYNFHTSDASEWEEKEFHHYPQDPTYYEKNRVTEYLTWRPIKRSDFITTKRQYSTWTEFCYTNNSAEGLYFAPTIFWRDMRTPSKRTYGSWEQVESKEITKTPTTLPPYPDPPINFTCYHCNGTPAVFSHENNLNNHIVEHLKNDTYKEHYNSSEQRRASAMPSWDGPFILSQDTEERLKGITQTRYADATYLGSIDYSYEMRNWNESFIERMKQRHAEGKEIRDWDRDSVVYQYYEDLKPTTIVYDSDYYYNSEEWAELQVQRKKRLEREKLLKNLKAYMSQNLTTFPASVMEPSNEFEKKKKAKMWNSLEEFRREYFRNMTRTTVIPSNELTTADDYKDALKDLAKIYEKFTSPTPTTKGKRPFDNLQDQINQYFYSMSMETSGP